MTDYERIAKALVYIQQHFKEQPTLEQVAEAIPLSPYHFQRLFKQWAGVSPKKFLQYLSLEHAKKILQENRSLAEAAFETGLSGSGRLHDLFVTVQGMTPGEFKNQGENLTIRYSLQNSQFGRFLVASTQKGICNLLFVDGDEKAAVQELRQLWQKAHLRQEVDAHQASIIRFFRRDFNTSEKINLHLKGTDFQLKVWEALLQIPEGRFASYGTIAHFIHAPSSQRAVGTAIGHNPVGYLIPCHRVIRSVGNIGGYRWGQTRKMAMIGWESARLQGATELELTGS